MSRKNWKAVGFVVTAILAWFIYMLGPRLCCALYWQDYTTFTPITYGDHTVAVLKAKDRLDKIHDKDFRNLNEIKKFPVQLQVIGLENAPTDAFSEILTQRDTADKEHTGKAVSGGNTGEQHGLDRLIDARSGTNRSPRFSVVWFNVPQVGSRVNVSGNKTGTVAGAESSGVSSNTQTTSTATTGAPANPDNLTQLSDQPVSAVELAIEEINSGPSIEIKYWIRLLTPGSKQWVFNAGDQIPDAIDKAKVEQQGHLVLHMPRTRFFPISPVQLHQTENRLGRLFVEKIGELHKLAGVPLNTLTTDQKKEIVVYTEQVLLRKFGRDASLQSAVKGTDEKWSKFTLKDDSASLSTLCEWPTRFYGTDSYGVLQFLSFLLFSLAVFETLFSRFYPYLFDEDAIVEYAFEGIPMIGFLGTVLGISLGLNGAWQVMSDTPAVRELALQRLTSAFGLAFDTTLMSLTLVLLLLLLRNVFFSPPK